MNGRISGKAAGELPRHDAPEAHLAEAGRIHQIAAVVERKHHRGDGGVLAPAHLGADLADSEPQAGLDRVEQAGFPGPGWPGDDRDPARQGGRELVDPFAGTGAGGIDDVPGGAAAGDQIVARVEVGLVDHDGGWNRVGLGHDEQPVDELGNRGRVGGGGDHQDFVDVGGDRSGAAAFGNPALEQGGSRLYRGDAVHLSGRLGLQQDPVSHHHPRRASLGLPAEDRSYFAFRRRYPVHRAVALENGAEQRGHQVPGAPVMASSSAALTSYSDSDSSRDWASAGVFPQARVSDSRCPAGRSPAGVHRTNNSAAP